MLLIVLFLEAVGTIFSISLTLRMPVFRWHRALSQNGPPLAPARLRRQSPVHPSKCTPSELALRGNEADGRGRFCGAPFAEFSHASWPDRPLWSSSHLTGAAPVVRD